MDDILQEASAVLECKNCSWYKNCVMPLRISPEDLQKQLKSVMGTPPPGSGANDLQSFLEGTASNLQNVVLEGCPVFIGRLRTNEKLAQHLKKLMQTWGMDKEPSKGDSK